MQRHLFVLSSSPPLQAKETTPDNPEWASTPILLGTPTLLALFVPSASTAETAKLKKKPPCCERPSSPSSPRPFSPSPRLRLSGEVDLFRRPLVQVPPPLESTPPPVKSVNQESTPPAAREICKPGVHPPSKRGVLCPCRISPEGECYVRVGFHDQGERNFQGSAPQANPGASWHHPLLNLNNARTVLRLQFEISSVVATFATSVTAKWEHD